MAANPVAQDDRAYYTPINTDLVVTTSSSPAYPAVNDLDVDSGTLTYSVVAGPTNGTLLAFHSTGTFTYRPNVAFVGVDTVTYKLLTLPSSHGGLFGSVSYTLSCSIR